MSRVNKELWRAVLGYEGLYEVSSKGRVRSRSRYQNNHGKLQLRRGQIKSTRRKKGYHILDLYRDGKQETVYLHRLVATAFIPNPDNKSTVNHISGNKDDNSVGNLEWATAEEQNVHLYAHHLKSTKSISKAITAMNKAQARAVECVETLDSFVSANEAARQIGLSGGTAIIRSCRHGCGAGRLKDGSLMHWRYV